MITLPGILTINVVQRDGNTVKTGLLDCSLGQFHVKYTHLDVIDEGQHEGFFNVARIQQHCYNIEGKYCFELEAIVEKIAFLFDEKVMLEPKSAGRKISQKENSMQPELFEN